MINIHRKQRGYAVLALTLAILLAVSLLTVFVTKVLVSEHRSSHNLYREHQAKQAAQAGLEYAINNLDTNRATIADNDTVTGTLPNNSTYSATYSFVGGNNDTVNITSTGYSVDGVVSQTASQQVKWAGVEFSAPTEPLDVVGAVTLSGNADISNDEGSSSVNSGSTVSYSGSAVSSSTDGSSNASGVGGDVVQNDGGLSGLTSDQLAQQVFGLTISQMANYANTSYTNSTDTNYSSTLNGLTNSIVAITQTDSSSAILNSNTTIGSSGNPVTIIVEGNISISGNVVIYGNVIASGVVSISGNTVINGTVFSGDSINVTPLLGNTVINGALIVAGPFNGSGNLEINYSSAELVNNAPSLGSYGKVPGTWKDN